MTKDQATRQLQMLHARRVYVHPMNTAVFWAVIAAGAWVGLMAFDFIEESGTSVAVAFIAAGAAGYIYERRKNQRMIIERDEIMQRPWPGSLGRK